MTGFRCFLTRDGNIHAANGWVMQPSSGVRIFTGQESRQILTGIPVEERYAAIIPPTDVVLVGGSGRNVFVTGLPGVTNTPNGLYSPTIPMEWGRSPYRIYKKDSSTWAISDGTDDIATFSDSGPDPAGSYDSTSYGEGIYTDPFTLTVAHESGWPGAIPAAKASISEGTAMGGRWTATDAQNYVSDTDSDWTIVIDNDGRAEMRYLTDVVAVRETGFAWDPSGEYIATELGQRYNPQELEELDDDTDDSETNPFGTLTLTFDWSGSLDLDIMVQFLEKMVGYGYDSFSDYMTWSGDATGSSGPEVVTIDLAAAWADGVIDTYADVQAIADWFPPHGGTGPATLRVEYPTGSYDETITIYPGSATPAVSPVLAFRVSADGTVNSANETWRANVTTEQVVTVAGYVYLEIVTTAGVLSEVNGPFFAAALPEATSDHFYVPIVHSDGTGKLKPIHEGTLIWWGVSVSFVEMTEEDYLALDPPDSGTYYDVILP